MKKIIIILTLILILTSCGGDNSTVSSSDSSTKPLSNNQPAKKKEKLLACTVLSKDFIQSIYPDTEILMLKEGGNTYPLCSARFKYKGSEYDVSLTLGVIGGADDATLEQAVSYFKKKGSVEVISGAGERAYNRKHYCPVNFQNITI